MDRDFSVVGHRGWPVRFPDNTLPGFLSAAHICDAVELDVRRSGDGKLVLAHDPSIADMPINSTPWEVLAEIDLGDGVKPCLFDEAVAALPDTPILMEIKNQPGDPGHEPDFRLALEAASRARPADVVISFNWDTIDAVRRHFPEVSTGLNLGLFGGLDNAIQRCLDGGHGALIPDVDLLVSTPTVLPDQLRTIVWSTRREETYVDVLDELVSMGVSGIITDDPQAARDLLRSRQ